MVSLPACCGWHAAKQCALWRFRLGFGFCFRCGFGFGFLLGLGFGFLFGFGLRLVALGRFWHTAEHGFHEVDVHIVLRFGWTLVRVYACFALFGATGFGGTWLGRGV
ncbi:hypothetical protein CSQ89_01005 [Chitinimonas sp. BJB300]|nr:hypothetical protein CSQ89_01005 [Chitinimonas sp. BJB300]TSJ85284.1 hypothetical protein FG002_017885 [Chitinimonas sp. BJB300]